MLTGDEWYISDVYSNMLHFHNCLEIGICHKHHGTLIFENNAIPFSEGIITCIPKHIPHSTVSAKGEESLWSYIFVNIAELIGEKTTIPELNVSVLFSPEENPQICTLVRGILQELVNKKTSYKKYVRGLFIAFQTELERIMIKQLEETTPSDKSTFNIAEVLEIIHTQYMNRLTIADLAEQSHLSETHFRRIFLSAMGTSPLRFINSLRIEHACELLLTTNDSILSISQEVGFSTISCFNRCFSQIMGVSPREYRKPAKREDIKPEHRRIEQYHGWMKAEKL